MLRRLLIASAAAGWLIAAPAGPAAAADGLVDVAMIAGHQMSCSDFRGLTVRTLKMTDLGDVGSARIMGRMPVILLDTDRLAKLPEALQRFFYSHECAHHTLGHSFAQTVWSEREADCWAIKHGRDKGWLSREEVVAWAPHFAHSRGSPIGHLPGPERANRLVACYDDPTDELVEPRLIAPPPMISASTGG